MPRMPKTNEAAVLEAAVSEQTKLYLLSLLTKEEKLAPQLEQLLKNHQAKIVKTEDLGERVLAFPIKKELKYRLVSVFFNVVPSQIKAIQTALEHEEQIARFLVTLWYEAVESKSKKTIAKAEVEEIKSAQDVQP